MNKKLRVLIVEDSEDDAALLLRELRSGGYEPLSERVETREAMADALTRQTWDVVTTDYSLPHFNGLEALKLLRSSAFDLPCIIVSGKIGEETAVQLMKAGANDYVMKGNLKRLAPAIERELDDAETRQERKKAEGIIERLNSVLRALRNVNQLITKENDRGKLLQGACDNMTATRGYCSAWVALFDETGESLFTAESGLGETFLPVREQLQRGELTECGRYVLNQPGLYVKDASFMCTDCPLATTRGETVAMAARLKYSTRTYGMMAVSLPFNLPPDMEEQSLFQELVDDIAFGLYKIEAEEQRAQAEIELRKRYKEQNCLFNILSISTSRGIPLDELLNRTVGFIPPGWQFPEIAEARIVLDGQAFQTAHFQETPWMMGSKIFVVGNAAGQVEVCYLEERPARGEGPFLKEERQLIDAIALRLGHTISLIKSEEALRESEGIFRYFMENSPIYIFLKDENIRALRLSKNFETMLGKPVAEMLGKSMDELFPSEFAKSMVENDMRIMKEGKTVTLEEELNGRLYSTVKFPILIEGKARYLAGYTIDITERKQAEITLRDEKERIRTILDLVGDPIFVKDNEHRITLANRAFYDIFCLDENSVIGHTLVEAVPENEREHFLKVDRRVLDTGITDNREEELTVKDLTRTIITRKIRFIDESGKKFLVGSIHDITERKRAEEKLQTTLKQLDTLISNMYAGVLSVSEDGKVMYVNQAFCELFNLSDAPDSLRGLTSPEMIQKIHDVYASPAVALARIQEITARGMPVKGEEIAIRGGRVFIVDYIPIIDSEGKRQGHIWHHQDITERKQAESFMKDIITKNPMSIQIMDKEGFTLEANPAHKLLFGSIPPSDYSIFNDLQLKQKGMGEVFDQLRNGEVVHFPDVDFNPHDSISEMPDVPVCVRTIGFPLCDSNDKPERFVLMHENITERKQAEKKLRESEHTARQTAEQLRMVDQISLNITAGLDFEKLMQTIYEQCKQIGDTGACCSTLLFFLSHAAAYPPSPRPFLSCWSVGLTRTASSYFPSIRSSPLLPISLP